MTFPVIALDYYDGATEGFMAHSDGADVARMFKMIAWDQDEDRRLFAVCDISLQDFMALYDLLVLANTTSGGSVWILSREFIDKADHPAEVNEILKRCKKRLITYPGLVMGKHIDDAETQIISVPEQIRKDVVRALSRRTPEDIKAWLDKLETYSSERDFHPAFQRHEGPSL